MTDKAKIRRNIEKMVSMGASDAEIDVYVRSEGIGPAKAKAPPAPKPRPPITAYVDTPAPRPARAAPRPASVMPVQPELLAPLRALGAQTRAPAPKPRPPRIQPAPVAMDPGVSSIFGGSVTPYAAPEFDPMTVKRTDTTPIPVSGGIDRAARMAGASFQRVGTGALRVIAAGMNAVSEGFGDVVTTRADRSDASLARGFEGAQTLDDLKANPSIAKFGAFVGEQMASSTGDIANLANPLGVVPYAVSQAGNIGQQRAENNSTGTATLTDIAKASPAAFTSTAAERLGTKYLLSGASGNLAVRLGKSAVSEGLTEGVQSAVEYTGGTLGTERGFNADEFQRQTVDGAVTGGLVGPGFRGLIHEVPGAAGAAVAKARDVVAERAEAREFSRLANAIVVDAYRPGIEAGTSAPAAPPAITEAPYRVEPAGRTVITTDKDGRRAFVAKVGETAAPAATTTPEAPKAAPKPVAPVTAPAAVEQPPIEQPAPAEMTKTVTPAPVEQPEPTISKMETVAPEPKADPVPIKPIAAREETRRVTIPTGGKIDVRMELVNADDITQAEGSKQNRDRDRAASEAQIMSIVGKFDPEQLGDDNYTDRGAPIIGPDGTIESGNGRVLAINRVFAERPEAAQAYRDYIESQGFDTKGIERPILIRRRVTEMDDATLRNFITGSNSDTKQELSAPERATQDASDILTPDVFTSYMGGALTSQRNGDFIRKFIDAVPDGQRSTFMDDKGNLSTAGVARIENAMLARAFGNGSPAAKRFLSKAMENTDNQTRTLTGALSEVAADWGKMTEAMQDGTVDKQYDLTDKVLEAIGMIADARAQGEKIGDVFAQRDAFNQMDPLVEKIIRSFYDGNLRRAAGRNKVAGILRSYAELASEQRADTDLFGNAAPPTASDLYAAAIEHQHEADLLATAADAGAEATAPDGARSDQPEPQAANDDDIPDIDTPDIDRSSYPLEDRAGYDPEFLSRSFTDRPSFFAGIVRTALDMDPDKFVLLPAPRQIFLLKRAVRAAFGITVDVQPGVQERFAIDQMLDMLQNVQGMAAILGIPARGMSLGGKLGLTIEKQARALGWFQPGTNMIGLPRRSNSFAHEWGHALDYHLLGTLSSTEDPITGRGLSGAIRQMGENLADADGIPNRDIRDGFIHLLNTMFFDKAGLATRVMDLEAKIAKTGSDKVRAELQGQIDNITAGNAKPRGLTSDFAKLSKAFGNKAGTQEYWTSPTEMLARAFEAYVSYKAESAGMSTEFIGKGDAAYLSNADERFAMTFPKGAERLRIFDAFDNIFAHIATQETLGAGAAAMPDPANKASLNPFERPETVAPRERNIFRSAIGREWDAIWSRSEARRKRLRDRPASADASILRNMHDALSFFKYGMTARLKMIGRRYDAPSVLKLHNMLTHTAGDKSPGSDYLRATELRMNQYQNVISLLVGNYNEALGYKLRTRELSIEDSDHLRDLLISAETTAGSKPMQTLAAGLRKLSDRIFYDMQRAGIDVGYARNGYLQRLYDDAIIGGDETGFLAQAAKAYEIAFERQWGDSDAVLANDEALATFLATARDLSRNGHDGVVDPYKAFAKIRKQITSLNRAIAAAEKAGEDAGTMQGEVAALDEQLSEAFGDLYDAVQAAWSKQAAADWLLKIQGSNPHEVDSRGPDGNFLKGRELPPEADKLLEKYMVRDPVHVMMLYSGKVARRIEYAERFGADNKKIEALFAQMGKEGVSAVGQDQVRAIFDVVTGRSVSTLPPGVNWAFEAIHVIWGTISLLPRAVWSSMSESVTAGLHAGNAKFAFKATGDLLASIVKTDGSRARADLARFAGIVSDRGGHNVLTERYGGSYANDTFLSDAATRMFYNTGLVALTRAQQGQMVGTAHAFLDCMSGWVVDGASAAPGSKAHIRRADAIARLEEYGVSDPDAFAKRVRAFDSLPTPADFTDGDPFTRDWITAIDRFVKGSIQSPTVMSRPEAASSAFGRLAYGIMSFNYEFYRNIIKGSAIRVGRQFERRRDIALNVGDGKATANAKAAAAIAPQVAGGLLASAAVLVAGQLLVSTIRMFLFDQERWKELDEKDDLAGYLITTAMGRTFATPLDPIIQAYTGYKYSGSAASNLSGPALSNIVQQVDAIGTTSVRNSEKTNTAEYNRAKAIYRLGIGPGAGMALQFIPGGSYISGAAGLATMAVTSTTTADAFAEKLIGEKGSVTDPETGEVTGPPKKKGAAKDADAKSKYVI